MNMNSGTIGSRSVQRWNFECFYIIIFYLVDTTLRASRLSLHNKGSEGCLKFPQSQKCYQKNLESSVQQPNAKSTIKASLGKGSLLYKKVTKLQTFSVLGGGAQPHSIAFGGVFPNITEAILMMKLAQK